jgi:transglutaminase-like putative cysteine protease
MTNSQIETTQEIRDLVKDIERPITLDSLLQIRDLMYGRITIRPYDDSTKEHEKEIRWKRTAGEILRDGYVYSGKACTDLTVLFIALCRALGLETSFIKVKNDNKVHSVAEIKLEDGWYIFDISRQNVPVKGLITKDSPYNDWQLWAKGRDAWDLGLNEFKDIKKIAGAL